MTIRPRFVLDTNVFVSALLFPGSKPGQAFFESRKRGEILLSVDAIKEITDVLRRPKFERYVLPEERDWFLATLIRQATVIEPDERIQVCIDSKDDKWLELAVAGNAANVISGDDDLLRLKNFRNIPIIAPADFLALLKE